MRNDEEQLPGASEVPGSNSTNDEVSFWALERLRRDVDSNSKGLELLTESVSDLANVVEPSTSDKPKKSAPVSWSWYHVRGEKRRELWNNLSAFVDWINARYFLDKPIEAIPGCWFEHGLVVEELTGVWAAWHSALHGAKEPTNDYAAWHRYYFWPAMERIRSAVDDCRRARSHETLVPRPVTPYPGLEDFIEKDCDSHDESIEVETESSLEHEGLKVDMLTGEISNE